MEREDGSEEEEEEIDDEELERCHGMMRQGAQEREKKNEEMEVPEVEDKGCSGEESEHEDCADSKDEMEPRLQPLFIRKEGPVTVQGGEAEALKQKELRQEAKCTAEDERKYTLKTVEEETEKKLEESKWSLAALDALNTDDENEEEHEMCKVRELKRIKQDREGREALEKEKAETEHVRNLTEEERRANGKVLTNKADDGKYKFLQKGAFFMDEDKEVYKRDFSASTLEDHFSKTILPKVV